VTKVGGKASHKEQEQEQDMPSVPQTNGGALPGYSNINNTFLRAPSAALRMRTVAYLAAP